MKSFPARFLNIPSWGAKFSLNGTVSAFLAREVNGKRTADDANARLLCRNDLRCIG
jgi:hypothetical protein